MSALEAARLLGISAREAVALAKGDPRLFAGQSLATGGAVERMKRWLAAGRPVADLSRLEYRGDEAVREIVVATLAAVPMPARWHAVTNVLWIEIGRGTPAGWMATVTGGARHVIALNGATRDSALPAVVCHELGHAWHATIATEPTAVEPTWSVRETHARHLAAFQSTGETVDDAVRLLYRPERLANEMAALWGHACHVDGLASDADRTKLLRSQLLAASDRANEIVAEVDRDLAACDRSNP